MTRRRAVVAAGLVAVGGVVFGGTALAALRGVHVGSNYFEDATVGDGKIEIRQGDQLRFITDDNGTGGKPHTAEVDELGIHSGFLATGETYTTPPIQQVGSFKLYCSFHEAAGHKTTLVVLSSGTATTTTAAPTTTRGTSPATAGGATGGSSSGATAAGGTGPVTAPSIDEAGSTGTVTTDTGGATDATLAPTGLGRASDEDIDAAPVDPRSLEAILGRPPATQGPWTRSVRMALFGLIPLLGAVAVALARFARGLHHPGAESELIDQETGTTDDAPFAPDRPRRARTLWADQGSTGPS